ncbi:integrase catalytic domain-containing protein [Trichonephila clavipes]|uniref:Integrase catalytic domain-containing protein n=1 Tax=Trichonephila clavipes TaxID=2585209 RepID=A0A8X6RYH0_TRICX|nr:integrase catalytic domain-containing protein [Trichonephila clavipes]
MGLVIPSKAKIIDLKKLIESSAVYKNDTEFVRSLVENALEKSKQEAEKNEREAEKNKRKAEKNEREAEIQLEKIKLSQIEKQLELEKVRKESEKNPQFLESGEPSTITDKLESLCNFRLLLCQLRKVNEFRFLCDLIISDKIFETLDRDTMNHIAMKQGETYFKPQQLGRECDVYLSARGKVLNDLMSRNPGSGVKTDGRNRLQTVSTWRQERNLSNVFVAETKTNCVLCKGNNFHPLSKCYQFKKLSVQDRVEIVKGNNLCFRCFLPHRLKECRSEKNCFCLRLHNSLIHFSRDKTRNPTPTSNLNLDASTFPGEIERSVKANSQEQFVATGFEKGRLKNVFLSTVRALVKNKYSQWVEVKCLLDVGSQSCLCTRACAEKLQLKMEKINTVVSCVNDASMVVKSCVKTSVANKAKTFESELMLLVVITITDLISNKVIDVDVNVSEFLPLADDKFNIPDRIDMLLGAEIFYELLKPGKFYCDNSHLVLQNTVFGYVVSGSVDQVPENRVHCGLIVDDDLNKTLKKFWEIEGVHIEPKVDTEVSLCEDHFVCTHRRNCEGRYVVSMALNKDPSCLGNSKDIAIRRLNSLWKRLSRDSKYLSLYAEFLKEYEELGHLERVVESSEPPTHYYISHHGVLRPEKLTTKLRIVFNGSSPTTTGISLNDILLKAQLVKKILSTLRLNISDIVLHTDSTIALAWLNTPANRLKTFVANRVAKVQELTEGFQWNHVPSVLNPADLVSWGLRPCDLPNLRLWWHGPQFLEKDIDQAETKLIRMVQEQVFLAEIKSLQSKGVVSPNSKLRNLNPFINSDGLLRVGGWLSNSDLPYVNKHPAILPGNHNLTVQIIAHFHRKNLHTGASSLLH